jgi:hypothetical protein
VLPLRLVTGITDDLVALLSREPDLLAAQSPFFVPPSLLCASVKAIGGLVHFLGASPLALRRLKCSELAQFLRLFEVLLLPQRHLCKCFSVNSKN